MLEWILIREDYRKRRKGRGRASRGMAEYYNLTRKTTKLQIQQKCIIAELFSKRIITGSKRERHDYQKQLRAD